MYILKYICMNFRMQTAWENFIHVIGEEACQQ